MHRRYFFALLAAAVLIPVASLSAATSPSTATADTTYDLASGVSLIIKEGSTYDSVVQNADSLTITVPAGEATEVRTAGPHPASVENDGGLATCDVLYVRDNQLLINGPKTVTLRPSTVLCDTTNYADDDTPSFTFSTPEEGATISSNSQQLIFWTTEGRGFASVRIRLSTDGGATFGTAVADGIINNGFYSWTVPEVTTTEHARLKIEGFEAGRVIALNLGPEFSIEGLAPTPVTPPVEPPAPTYDYSPSAVTATATSIGDDKSLVTATLPSGTLTCVANSRIKSVSSSSVYYCGRDGKRYVFPNQKTHDSWYDSFAGVITISDADMAKIPLGGNVTYRPGVRLVKIQTDPKVYAVAANGTLRWVSTETIAVALYGADWNRKVDDVPDAFFVNYTVGQPIE